MTKDWKIFMCFEHIPYYIKFSLGNAQESFAFLLFLTVLAAQIALQKMD